MYEVTLSIEKENENFLRYVEEALTDTLTKIDGVKAFDARAGRSFLSVACPDLYKKALSDRLSELSAEVLVTGYKKLYIRDRLHSETSDLFVNTLINTMCVFDSASDRQFVGKILKTEGNVCLDGYFHFRMKRLKEKWNEVLSLVSANNVILSDRVLLTEFLSYLIEEIPSGVKDLSVVLDGKNIRLFDGKNRLLKQSVTVCPSTAEELAVLNMICLKPDTVTLYCDPAGISRDFVELTDYLFDAKLVKNR